MPIEVTKQAAIPPGRHTGVIVECVETTKTFDPQRGPEEVVEITIQPKWRQDEETDTVPVCVTFSPVLNGLSALSQFLKRIGKEPEANTTWNPASICGTEIAFSATLRPNGFVVVAKDSIRTI